MPTPHASSPSSAPCRLDLGRSRGLTLALAVLACAAALAPWFSALAGWPALPVSLTALGCGMHACLRAWRLPLQRLVVPWDAAYPVTLDGKVVHDFAVGWRGSLATLRWRTHDRRAQCRLLWPDALAPAQRRELRLAAQARDVSRRPPSMAP